MALAWIKSYLSDRTQRVILHPFKSEAKPLWCGVPQGSALSPLRFNIYLAPLCAIISKWGIKTISYADNTQLVFSFKDHTANSFERFRGCLCDVSSWMNNNKLKLNAEKTEVLFFGKNPPPTPGLWWPEEMGSSPCPTSTAKNVSVKWDSDMTFASQIRSITSTCFGILKGLRKFLYLLPESCRKLVVHATVTSRLYYANSLYLGLPAYLIKRLQMVQNAAARLIRRVKFRQHISPHIKQLHWLLVVNRIEFKAMIIAFKA